MIQPPDSGETVATPMAELPPPISEDRGIVRAAAVLAMGNVTSRVLGLARETVKASLFGTEGVLAAFTIATYVPMSLFQLIVGGEMVNSSLVPVFSDYAASSDPQKRAELWEVVSIFLSLAVFVLALFVVLVEVFAPQVALLLGAGKFSDSSLQLTTVSLMRIATPAVLFLSLASLLSGVLYALKRFTLPAFTAAVLNGTITVVALLTGRVEGLVWGLLLGAGLQVIIQLPALRDGRLRWRIDPRHPALRRILILYLPIVAGLVVNQLSVGFSYRLAAGTGDSSIPFMNYATTLLQFPLGLVVTALSVATLPTLSQQANGELAAFKRTLAGGLRLVITLILPATAGLFALAVPIVALVFGYGQFTAQDTTITALVLRAYLIGLPFAAVDQMLVFASYARKDTWRPALVGVISIGVYLLVAVALLKPLSLLSLMLADAIKHIVHTALMLWLLQRHLGGLRGHRVGRALLKAGTAALLTGLGAYWLGERALAWFASGAFLDKLVVVLFAGGGGGVIFMIFVALLDIDEIKSLRHILRRRA